MSIQSRFTFLNDWRVSEVATIASSAHRTCRGPLALRAFVNCLLTETCLIEYETATDAWLKMWDKISRADLEATKEQLRTRREEMIRRHTEELEAIEQDRAQLETLDQLIDAIADKFNIGGADQNQVSDGVHALEPENTDGVSFLITQAQKSKLREMGIGDDQIRTMKPNEAHRILGLAS